MRAAVACALFAVACAGCNHVRACKGGSILLSVDVPAGTEQVELVVSIDAVATAPQTVRMPAGKSHGTIELDFSTYPGGHALAVQVTARAADVALGSAAVDRVVAAGCDAISLTVQAGGEVDLGAPADGGGGGACSQASDCPPNQACDVAQHQCTTSCNAGQPCNGGCCDGAQCAAGTELDRCGSGGGACASCQSGQACQSGACGLTCAADAPCRDGCCDGVRHQCVTGTTTTDCALGAVLCDSCDGNAAGAACVSAATSSRCGCNGPTDCPRGQACDTTTHTCGSACDLATACNGGCCSAATNGTCQQGLAVGACGANGGLCADCGANQNGHLCVAVTAGGQCGCGAIGDCPATSSSCTSGLCVNACSSATPCQNGCCTGGNVCSPGTADAACGGDRSSCQSCATNGNGHVCLSTRVCGCNQASDCPTGQACDVTQHKCTTACGANQPCHGGCCSASSGGTCQAGSTTGACGSSGICSTCPTNTTCASYSCNGTSCVASFAGATTGCDDGNLCTFGDACNGAGSCVGAQVNCPADTDCTVYQCNGTSTCTPHNLGAGTSCGFGFTCCTGGPQTCDGNGRCLSNGCCSTTLCCNK